MNDSKKASHSCVIINLNRFDTLAIPHPIYKRGVERHRRYIAEDNISRLRKPIMITGDEVSLIITEKEWTRILRTTKNSEIIKVYQWEQRGRFKYFKKRQRIFNDRVLRTANRT